MKKSYINGSTLVNIIRDQKGDTKKLIVSFGDYAKGLCRTYLEEDIEDLKNELCNDKVATVYFKNGIKDTITLS